MLDYFRLPGLLCPCRMVVLAAVISLLFGHVAAGEIDNGKEEDDRVITHYRLRLIKGGSFMMGSPLAKEHSEYHPDEAPRQVNVADFYLGSGKCQARLRRAHRAPRPCASTLRHTCLRNAAKKKGVRFTQKLSGHKNPTYIWRYVQPSDREMEEAMESLK